MLTIARARDMAGPAGEPLPVVFPALAKERVHIRRGQLTLVASGPAVGKSAVALTVAVRARVPTLYVSADSDAHTQYVRMAAMLNQMPTWQVEADLEKGLSVHYDTQLARVDHLRWCFEPTPTTADITNHMHAFAYAWGCWPALVVVDNIKNVWSDLDNETARVNETTDYLSVLGRQTGAAVMALHHLTGEYDDGIKAAPMSALLGKISKIPTTILTLYKSGDQYGNYDTLNVCPVKVRGGKADPAAGWSIPLEADLETMTIG